ncbi:hypothetical protein AERO8C_70659 [Aeromonas veronii]|uniref:Uncharacterized protein n=1 Tax=Aeromonas veronii TaxID=654 RepID=A0A653LCA0_AERVE|nr:hypothetical protein AERO8C_70659 [Aeromonas veronii]
MCFGFSPLYWRHLVGVLTVERREAETVNSGSVEPDQVKTCEGNKGNLRVTAPGEEQASSAHRRGNPDGSGRTGGSLSRPVVQHVGRLAHNVQIAGSGRTAARRSIPHALPPEINTPPQVHLLLELQTSKYP